jgi:hypothetical protein
MGSMSASDAAPLPRLGEVYFDVRGDSRSMRLSWYADTGVAVFSIWQGGTCTGTFRLPIADLPRMVQALQRGPDGEVGGPPAQPATGQARRGDPVRDPQPSAPGNDVETGAARGGRRHGSGRAPTRHTRDPAGEYGEELSAGHPVGGRASDYGDEPGGGYAEGRHASARRSVPHEEEPPTGVYHEDDPGHSGGGRGGYEPEPAGPYPDDSLPGAYRDDSLSGSGAAYHDDGDYRPEPAGPFPGGHRGRYEPERTGAYSGGGYEDEPTGVYRGDLLGEGYDDERGDRYPAAEYPADPLDPDYPTGPSEPGYPGAQDPLDNPVPSRDPGSSAAYPHAGPRHQDAGPSPEERAHEPRRSSDRREAQPAPDPFLYGQPPSEREARGRST